MTIQIQTRQHRFQTRGKTDIIDLTERVQAELDDCGLLEGQVTVFAIGSTAAISIVEYEPGLVQTDIPRLLEQLTPYRFDYAHHNTWGDDNGAAHLRATLMGGSYSLPFVAGRLLLGTWQQIIYLDFDTRPRSREVVFQFIGQ
ncbi:MAG: secondary thiamine-phosphate synthase enzyme YjbQ [Leptospiraceae bacterium]|nr:secondary thiamine-phosphate synthase enzyme YjbQ [Leptospiraceae bacterium]